MPTTPTLPTSREMFEVMLQVYKRKNIRKEEQIANGTYRLPAIVQTMKRAYQQICAREAYPWVALGNFRNAWYGYATHIRADLVKEPLEQPEKETWWTRRWGAFCAASVEFLCGTYDVPCPEWVHDSRYNLSRPWYMHRPKDLSMQKSLREDTQPPFACRNIFCGSRLYQNKYELTAWTIEAWDKGIRDPGEATRYAHAKERSVHRG